MIKKFEVITPPPPKKKPLKAHKTVYICGFHTLLENMLVAYAV